MNPLLCDVHSLLCILVFRAKQVYIVLPVLHGIMAFVFMLNCLWFLGSLVFLRTRSVWCKQFSSAAIQMKTRWLVIGIGHCPTE